MRSRVLTLVQSWLVIDFFADSRRTGEAGSSLTSTIFAQSFVGLLFAAVFLPEEQGFATAYLAANLSLSTCLIGIGVLGEPKRQRREAADELLVRTAPMPAGSLALARALHASFSLSLITTGMAIPPAILAYWACDASLLAVGLYLVLATVVAGFMAAGLALVTRLVFLILGPGRAQLFAGTLKALLLAGGLIGFALCLPHLSDLADDLPFGRTGAMLWPPYWAARAIAAPTQAGMFWGLLAGTGAALFALGTLLQSVARNRVQSRPSKPGLLGALDHWFTKEGPLLGVTRFVAIMLFRSPGFRARVLPLFGIPFGMVALSLWDMEKDSSRSLLLGMTLQFPAIFLPFLVAFLPRSDQERAGWIFRTTPQRDMALYRTASLVALSTHVLLPIQLAAAIGLLIGSDGSLGQILFAVAMPLFSLGLGVLVAEFCLQRLQTEPFTEDADAEEGGADFGGMTGTAIVLALVGGGVSTIADGPLGLVAAVAILAGALARLRRNCSKALA